MGGGQSQPDAAEGDSVSSLSTSMKLAHTGIAKRFPKARHISTQALQAMIDERNQQSNSENPPAPLIVLDVRPEEEYSISHIDGSIPVHMDTAKNEENLQQFVNDHNIGQDNSTIVCYCSAGYRSSFMAEKLQSLLNSEQPGSESKNISVYNLEGSIFQWANENRAMVDKDGQPTKYAHPYNTVFGKLLNHDLRKWPDQQASS